MTSPSARASASGLIGALEAIVGPRRLHHGDAGPGPGSDRAHDEALGVPAQAPPRPL